MSKRIGPKMALVAEYVSANPGCSKSDAGHWACAPAPLMTLYGAVNRAIRAGLVKAARVGGRYYLYPATLTLESCEAAWAAATA